MSQDEIKEIRSKIKELQEQIDAMHHNFMRLKSRIALLIVLHSDKIREQGINPDIWLTELPGWKMLLGKDRKYEER